MSISRGEVIYINPVTLKPYEPIKVEEASIAIKELIINLSAEVARKYGEKDVSPDTIISKLNDFVDSLFNKMSEAGENLLRSEKLVNNWLLFYKIPQDTRFPYTSLADHMMLTSAIATSIGLHLYYKSSNLLVEGYSDKLVREILESDAGVRAILRFSGALHDIAKPKLIRHAEESGRIACEVLRNLLGQTPEVRPVINLIENIVARHHFKPSEGEPPETCLEYIVAIGDKIAAMDRLPLFEYEHLKYLLDKMEGLIDKYPNLRTLTRENIQDIRVFLKSDSEEKARQAYKNLQNLFYGFLSPDEQPPPSYITEFEKKYNVGAPISFLIIEVSSIQSFISLGGSLKDFQGASLLVDSAIKLLAKKLKQILGIEFILSSDAGQLIAIVPSAKLKDIYRELMEYLPSPIRDVLVFKSNYEVAGSYSLRELKHGLQVELNTDASSYIESLIVRERRKCVGAILSRELAKTYPERDSSSQDISVNDLCKNCGYGSISRTEDFINSLGNLLPQEILQNTQLLDSLDEKCTRCQLTHLYARIFREAIMTEDSYWNVASDNLGISDTMCFKITKKVLSTFKELFVPLSTFDRLEEEYPNISDKRFYQALLIGDGDNFGSLKMSLSSTISLYRTITSLFKVMLKNSIIEGLSATCRKKHEISDVLHYSRFCYAPFIMIYSGGDDFMLLLEAPYIPAFLRAFREKLKNIAGDASSTYNINLKMLSLKYIGVSIGVSIASYTDPLIMLRDVASFLESESKLASKNLQESHLKYGSDIVVSIFYSRGSPPAIDRRYFEEFYPYPETGENLFGTNKISHKLVDATHENMYRLLSSNLRSYLQLLESGYTPQWIRLKMLYDSSRRYRDVSISANFRNMLGNTIEFLTTPRDHSVQTWMPSALDIYDFTSRHLKISSERSDIRFSVFHKVMRRLWL